MPLNGLLCPKPQKMVDKNNSGSGKIVFWGVFGMAVAYIVLFFGLVSFDYITPLDAVQSVQPEVSELNRLSSELAVRTSIEDTVDLYALDIQKQNDVINDPHNGYTVILGAFENAETDYYSIAWLENELSNPPYCEY